MPNQNLPSPDAIRTQLNRILQSSGFAASPRLQRFLSYLVESKLGDRAADLKEYTVGLEVFDRPASFDPKTDSIVRASARKLRAKLDEYYRSAGAGDAVLIAVPKGGYAPEFRMARTQPPPGRNGKPVSIAAVLVLGVLGILSSPARFEAHPSIAVLEVNNASADADDAWLSTALAEMLTEDLSANEGLKTATTEQVARWRQDGSPHGRRLQDLLGVRYVVRADFQVIGRAADGVPAVRVETRLERLRDGNIVVQASDRGSETQLYALTGRIAQRLSLALGVHPGESQVRSGPDRDSMRLYSEAVVKLRESDPLAARSLLERSVRAEPSNFLARSLLAETYLSLGMEAPAKVEAQAGLALAPPLPPVERLALEARCQTAMRDYPSAIRSYRKLWRMSPESIEYGFNIAEAQEKSGLNSDALQTLRTLRNSHPSPLDEVHIDLSEAIVRAKLGEYRNALTLVRRSGARAHSLGARYLYARSRLLEGGLLMNLVQPGYLPILDEGLSVCREQGYRTCELNALRQEGNVYCSTNPKRAMELYTRGVAIARQLGNRRGLVELLRGMAFVADRQLLDAEAERRLREIVQMVGDEKLSDKAGEQADLAELLVAEGRLDEAYRALQQMDPAAQQSMEWNLAMAEIERGREQYKAAARRVQAQVELARKTDDKYALGLALEQSFWVHLWMRDYRRAAADADELNRIWPYDPVGAYLRAELAIRQEQWGPAQAQAAEASRRLQSQVDRPLEAAVTIVRAEALVGVGRPDEALRTLNEITPALEQSRRKPLQLRARLCRLRAQAIYSRSRVS